MKRGYKLYHFRLSGELDPIAEIVFDCDPLSADPSTMFYKDLKAEKFAFIWQDNNRSISNWVRGARTSSIDLRWIKDLTKEEFHQIAFADLL